MPAEKDFSDVDESRNNALRRSLACFRARDQPIRFDVNDVQDSRSSAQLAGSESSVQLIACAFIG
jgi:hypothetical protein